MKIAASPWALIFLSLIHHTTAAPTPPQCRCFIVDSHKPWAPSSALGEPTGAGAGADQCAPLGQELERWRTTNPSIYQTVLETVVGDKPRGTPTEADLKPLPTSVLLEMARSHGVIDNTDAALPSAPTSLVHERIICRTAVDEEEEYHDSVTTLFVLGVIIVMAILACVAECLTLLTNWCLDRPSRRRSRRNRVRLSGGEKKLRAYSSGESSSACPGRVNFNVSHAYSVEGDEDEDTTPVL